MDEVEALLPNGFHDGELKRLAFDVEAGTFTIEVDFWITEESSPTELYRLGRVTVSGCEQLRIDGHDHLKRDDNLTTLDDCPPGARLPSGAFTYSLYVFEWNGFIHFSGQSAKLEWLAEAVDREA